MIKPSPYLQSAKNYANRKRF